jgi:hypothetical protein
MIFRRCFGGVENATIAVALPALKILNLEFADAGGEECKRQKMLPRFRGQHLGPERAHLCVCDRLALVGVFELGLPFGRDRL